MSTVDSDNFGCIDFIEFLEYQYSLCLKLMKDKYHREEKRMKRLKFKSRQFTEAELGELQTRFEGYDSDRSGSLEMTEISFLLKDVNLEPKTAEDQNRLAKLLRRVGFQGSLAFTEFTKLLKMIREELETEQEEKDMALAKTLGFDDQEVDDFHEVFNTYDVSGDGKLNQEETRTLFINIGMEIPNKLFDATYEALDSDGSGVLEFGEFLRMMRTLTDLYSSGVSRETLASAFASAASAAQNNT